MASVSFGTFTKKRNSTKQPTSLSDQRTVVLKESCSQDSPIFICTGNNFNYNYCQWDGKYYFINDIISLRNNEIEIHCVLDVLATYKSEITSSTQFVAYSSHNSSTWLPDTRIPVLKNCKVSSNTSLTGILSSIGCYILSVVGQNSCCTFLVRNEGTLKTLLANISTWMNNGITAADALISTWRGNDLDTYTFTPDTNTLIDLGTGIAQTIQSGFQALTGTLANIQKALADSLVTVGRAATDTGFVGNSFQNAPECIRSCIWVPFDYALANTSGQQNIHLGTYDTGLNCYVLQSTPATGSNTVNIPWHYSDWRRGYCEDVYLYLPFVGLVAISADSITNASSITINWSATYTDGTIMYKVEAGGEVIGAYGGKCAVNYPLGVAQQASAGEIAQAAWGGAEKVVSQALKSNISPVSVIGMVVGTQMAKVSGTYDTVNTALTTHVSSVGGIGGGAAIGLGRDCICYTVAHDLAVTPSDMSATMGRPTMQPMSLSTLSGFCQCVNGHVAAPATAEELDALDTYLNSGFYIE